MTHTVSVGPVQIGPDRPLTIIAGPCMAESLELCLQVGTALRDRCAQLGLGYIFKASFDKANRTSIHSERGPGLDAGLDMLAAVKRRLDVPVTTDIHEPAQAAPAGEVVDLLQIPAFLCRQTDLLTAAAATDKVVNVKKGQFLSPAEMTSVVGKLTEARAAGLILTERGTFFGYHRLVNDFAGVREMMGLGWPVCFDATHSTQLPGAGTTSGGRREFAPILARCAVATGVDAVFIEAHPDPDNAMSDAASMMTLADCADELARLVALRAALHQPAESPPSPAKT